MKKSTEIATYLPNVTKLIQLEFKKAEEKGPKALRVLVADDERLFVDTVCYFLKSLGHDVVGIAVNGDEVIDLARRRKPDLILMDVNMPSKDGIAAAKRILQEMTVAIVLSSGMTDERTLKRAEELSIQAFLVKPYSIEQLKSSIHLALSSYYKQLAADVEISRLKTDLEMVRYVDKAIELLRSQYQICRAEAIDQLEAAARAQQCALVDVAKHTIRLLGTPGESLEV